MKLNRILLCMLALLGSIVVQSYPIAKIDGIYYDLSSSTAEVTYQNFHSADSPSDIPSGYDYLLDVDDGDYYYYDSDMTGSVTIPSTVTYNGKTYKVVGIGHNAFDNCSVTSITIQSNNLGILDPYAPISENAFKNYRGALTINCPIPDCKEYNDDYDCWDPYYPFSYCKLTSLTLGSNVTSIRQYEFKGCSNLTSVTIPNSVTSIGQYAFYDCSGLTSVKVDIESPLSISSSTFSNRANATLYVPYGSKAAYKAADYWREFKEIVEIIEFADANVKALCIAKWDTNRDGELSETEAVAVSNLGSVFLGNKTIISFDELQYFTGLTSIGDDAFWNCSGLTSITLPNSVTNIGDGAFFWCSGLTSITIGNSVTSIGNNAFHDCSRLTSVTIPNSVMSIGDDAFWGCSGLTSITIGNSVMSIGEEAFYNCSSLTSVTIPNSVTSIGNSAFWCCSGLTSITIGNSVTSIGNFAFYNCSGLTSVTIPNSVTSIEGRTFDGCIGLTSITIGNSVTSIGNLAFSGCSGLTSVTIPNSVTSIKDQAFYGCRGLTSITIPNSVTSIGSSAFGYCSGLTTVTIPNSMTSIEYSVFYNCSGLTSVTIPNSVTSIGDDAFSNCTGLTSITLPNSVTSIGNEAFYNCSSLTSVTIPNSVTSIGEQAFYNYDGSGLTSVKVDKDTPISIGSYTFSNRANATLYVPYGSKAEYEAADYWKEFKEIIEFVDGDVNSDYDTDVLDVVDIVRYVVGTPAETFVAILADINSDGTVNVADAVVLVNEIAGDQNFAKGQRMAPKRSTNNDELLTLTEQEDHTLSLALVNQHDYTAFQFDLYVPEGTDVARMLLNAQRKQKHQLLYNKVEEGHYRVAAISTSNRIFQGNDGELLSFTLDCDCNGEIVISDIHFFDTDGGDYMFEDISLNGVTGIPSLTPTPSPKGEGSIYTLDGRRVSVSSASSEHSVLPKGVYIVNGKKVMVK